MYGVFRVDKINNTHKMYGIEKHVERRNNTSNTNPQINRAQSSKNYDLHDKFDETCSPSEEKAQRSRNNKNKKRCSTFK